MAFPKVSLGVAGLVALVPLFLLWSTLSWHRAFLWGWFSGSLYALFMFYWIAGTIFSFVGHWSIPLLLIVCAFEGLAWAGVAVVASIVGNGGFRTSSIFALPAAWLLLESARSYGSLGLPFGLLGHIAAHLPWLLPVASYGGVYLLTTVVALTNGAVAGILSGAPGTRRVGLIVILSVALCTALADVHEAHVQTPAPTVRVAIAQGDIQQRIKWTPTGFAQAYAAYADLSRLARKHGARVVVWPETAIAAYSLQDPSLLRSLGGLARENRIAVISGTLDQPKQAEYYNAVLDITPRGLVGGIYHKRWLMPFAEFLPLGAVLHHVRLLSRSASGFRHGDSPVVFPAAGLQWGALICYESGFASYARDVVRAGADVIVMTADDAWFEGTQEPYLHADIAAIEAASTGRWVVRSTQTGISGFVDPKGEVMAQLGLEQRGIVLCSIGRGFETAYDRFGAAWIFALALATLIGCVVPAVLTRSRAS